MPDKIVALLQPAAVRPGTGVGIDGKAISLGTVTNFALAAVKDARSSAAPVPASSPRWTRALKDGLSALERSAAAVEARDRKGGGEGKSVSVRVDIGGRRMIKKKKKK